MESASLGISWFQNLALILSQDSGLPVIFDNLGDVVNGIFSLDFGNIPLSELITNIQKYTALEFRAQFTIINVIVPLLLSIITLFFFESFLFNVWYVMLMLMSLLISLGVFLFLLPEANYSMMSRFNFGMTDVNDVVRNSGNALLILLGLILFCYSFCSCSTFCQYKIVKRIFKSRKKVMKILGRSKEDDPNKENEFDLLESALNRTQRANDPFFPPENNALFAANSDSDEGYSESQELIEKEEHSERETGKESERDEEFDIEVEKDNVEEDIEEELHGLGGIGGDFNFEMDEFVLFSPVTAGRKRASDELFKFKEKEAKNVACSWKRVCKSCSNCCVCCFLVLLALFLTRAIQLHYFSWENNVVDEILANSTIRIYALIAGICCSVVAYCLCCQTSCWACPVGRQLEWKCVRCCEHWMLRIILMLLTFFYTPIVTSLLSSFMCSNYTCPLNYEFPINFNILAVDSVLDTAIVDDANYTDDGVCQQCIFHNNSGCSAELAEALCPPIVELRLDSDPSILCYQEIAFFWPATVLLIFAITIGIPVFFFVLIFRSSRKLRNIKCDYLLPQHVPLWIRKKKKAKKLARKYRKIDPEKFDKMKSKKYKWNDLKEPEISMELVLRRRKFERDLRKKLRYSNPFLNFMRFFGCCTPKIIRKMNRKRWIIRTALSVTPTKSLYHAFEPRWRYFKLFNILVKLALILVSILLIDYPWISLPLMLIIHLSFCCIVCCTMPYMNCCEDCFSVIISAILVFDAAFYLVSNFFSVPSWTFYPFLLLNMIVPVLAIMLCIYALCARKRSSKKYKKTRKKLEKQQRLGNINVQEPMDFRKIDNDLKVADQVLDADSMSIVKLFFKVLGLVCFLCLIFCMFGMLIGEFNPTTIPSQYELRYYVQEPTTCEGYNELEYAGYSGWSEFTDNCCCRRTRHFEYSALYNNYQEVELWKCRNENTKIRVRDLEVENIYLNSTGVVRDFCSKDFKNGFQVVNYCEYENSTDIEMGWSYVVGEYSLSELGYPEYEQYAEDNDEMDILLYYW